MKKYIILSALIFGALYVSHETYACTISSNSSVFYRNNSNKVKEVQNCLIEKGYDLGGPATGYYGSMTTTAVKDFYKNNLKINWDGRSIGPKGLAALKNSSSAISRSCSKTRCTRRCSRPMPLLTTPGGDSALWAA
jgi:hypothetical protein